MSSGTGGFGSAKGTKSGKSSVRTQIPAFLQPLIAQLTGTAGGALGEASRLTNGELVSPFDPIQTEAQNLAIDRARNGPFISTAQDTLLGAAKGTPLDQFLDPAALSALRGAAGGTPLDEFLDPQALASLREISAGTGSAIPGVTTDTLTGTAQGDFLFGGQGFDEAVQAAVRAARPGIISTFGGSGVGGGTGALSQAAIGTSATDAFARQFSQERINQLNAAGKLGDLNLTDREREERNRLAASGELTSQGSTERGRGLTSAGLLGEFGSAERDRALNAATQLPGIGEADINLLNSVGNARQGQAQNELSAPLAAQLQLLSAALGGLPIEQLLGSDSKSSEKTKSFLTQLGFKGSFGGPSGTTTGGVSGVGGTVNANSEGGFGGGIGVGSPGLGGNILDIFKGGGDTGSSNTPGIIAGSTGPAGGFDSPTTNPIGNIGGSILDLLKGGFGGGSTSPAPPQTSPTTPGTPGIAPGPALPGPVTSGDRSGGPSSTQEFLDQLLAAFEQQTFGGTPTAPRSGPGGGLNFPIGDQDFSIGASGFPLDNGFSGGNRDPRPASFDQLLGGGSFSPPNVPAAAQGAIAEAIAPTLNLPDFTALGSADIANMTPEEFKEWLRQLIEEGG